jgi:serine/threonine-protein kinase
MVRPADTFEAGLLRAFAELPTGSVYPPDLRAKPAADALAQQSTLTFVGPVAAADTPRTDPRKVGPYTLIEQIGRGGMGVVYRAVHKVINRTVALKTLYPGGERRPELLARFRREGEAVARLEHPNIVRIYDFDEWDGVPYYSMELVEGETLAKRLSRGNLAHKEAAELVRVVAGAVEYAHRHKVIHRDLKPSNVLIAADGTAKVTDFGLAKVLDEGRVNLSETDAVMGTPSYMAPEQAAGRISEVGPAADVYALGAILYESLTGVPPFASDCKLQTLALVQSGILVPPSGLRKGIPHDLEAVCLKCLARSPRDRFPSAEALAEELGRWLGGERTVTRPQGPFRKVLRRVNNRRMIAGAAVVAVAAVLMAVVLPGWDSGDTKSEEIRTPDGRLLPFIVRYGGEQTKVTAADDGTITVNTWGLCLLEFIHDRVSVPYCLKAHVRHNKSDVSGRVGVYFADRAFPGTFGECHQFGRMMYNDLLSPRDAFAIAAREPPDAPPMPLQNKVRLDFVTRLAARARPWTGTTELASGAAFEVCGNRADCWRELAVTVTPDGVSGTFDGRPVGLVSADKITAAFREKLENGRQKHPDDDLLRTVASQYDCGGTFGMVVEQSSAAFRHVEVKPGNGTK